MLSLQSLFENNFEDDVELMQESIKSKKNLNFAFKDIPDYPPPPVNSERHREDLKLVQDCHLKPSLSAKFLDLSHEKVEKVFKKYCDENNLKYDKPTLKRLNKQLSKVVKKVKDKYQRQRPKDFMLSVGDNFPCENIPDMDSYSYPSGHTAHAYFNAGILSKEYPEHANELRTLAELIGQSRLDNGVHFPSDVEFGRYIGELAFRSLDDNIDKIEESSNKRATNGIFRKVAENLDMNHSLFNNCNEQYAHDLAEFIRRSNEIELYDVSYESCLDASKLFIQGFPGEYCTDNHYIRSHLEALTTAAKFKPIDSFTKITNVHKSLGAQVLERGAPGVLRDFKHSSRSGTVYPDPPELIDYLDKWSVTKEHPFIRHAFYEWIHPFGDGNGRSGRILLAAEMDFNFSEINKFIDNNYLDRVIMISDKIDQGFLR